MSPESVRKKETVQERLYRNARNFLDKYGIDGRSGMLGYDDVGRNIQAKVHGPLGWNLISIEEVINDRTRLAFEEMTSTASDGLMVVEFEGADAFLLGSMAVIKKNGYGAYLPFESAEEFEVELLAEDLGGLWEEI